MPGTPVFPFVPEPPLPADALADVRQLLQRPQVQLVLIALRDGDGAAFLVALSGNRYVAVPCLQALSILVSELHVSPLEIAASIGVAIYAAIGRLREGASSYVILGLGKPEAADQPLMN